MLIEFCKNFPVLILLQDETPLYVAAREGSYEACKILLDNLANRDITDHMEMLPHDIAEQRQHADIVRLIDEHVPHSPQVIGTMHNNGSSSLMSMFYFKVILTLLFIFSITTDNLISGLPHHLMSSSTFLGSTKVANKSKKRPKFGVGPSSPSEPRTPQTLRRKISPKKPVKKLVVDTCINSIMGLDTNNLYSNPGLTPVPVYKDAMKSSNLIQSASADFQSQQHQPYHFPAFQEPSPPHSITFSPPAKTHPLLPTSPTHITAMRTAAQQNHLNMPFADPFNLNPVMQSNPTYQQSNQLSQSQQQQQQQQLQYYHFLTPPSEPTERNSYPTPSPESPHTYYWSSSSPHSNSDWSEGTLSPNSSSQGNKQQDAIFI